MSNDNKNDNFTDSEDTYYHSEYDEDTVDYELDSDKFLEDDDLQADPPVNRGEEPAVSTAPDEPELEDEQEPGEEWYDDDEAEQSYDEHVDAWPFGLIAVGIIALLLLVAGGYGVLQQRTQMEVEIRQLRATLATTTSNTELASSRQTQRSLSSQNTELQAQLASLEAENQSLKDKLSRATSGPTLKAVEPTPEAVEPGPEVVKPSPRTVEPSPEVVKLYAAESAPQPQGSMEKTKLPPTNAKTRPASPGWFVNFGSYTREATAKSWASRLKVDEGRVVVLPGKRANTQYYRVRIIDLPNKQIAGKIALQLEQSYKLPRLWVGQQ